MEIQIDQVMDAISWFVGVSGSIVVLLLSVIAYFVKKQYDKLDSYSNLTNEIKLTNSVEHKFIKDTLETHNQWTRDVYDRSIIPTEKRSQKNEKDIGILKVKVEEHDEKLKQL